MAKESTKKSVSKNISTTSKGGPDSKAVIEKMLALMSNPGTTKIDIARYLKQNVDNNPDLESIFGAVSDDVLMEIEENNFYEETEAEQSNVNGYEFEVLDIVKMNKEQKRTFVEIPSMEEARYLEDIYYQTQAKRIIIQNQLRALKQGADNNIPTTNSSTNKTFLEWYLYNTKSMESQIKMALEVFSDSNYLSRWAKRVKGIGPVIATCLAANLEIKENESGGTDMHAGNWWSYCGLNDNNRPWLGNKKSLAIFNECLEENNMVVDDTLVAMLLARTQWPIAHYEKMARNENGTWNKEKLVSASAIIPYNKKMKVLCYKIGHSFLMCKNKEDSLYGRLLRQRLELEKTLNERGAYAEQAANILEEKKFNHSTNAWKAYSQGKLPDAHINARCQRYVTKMFISHLFEAAYYNKFGKPAPNPYVLSFIEGHADYIGPEVPYNSVPRDK